MAPRLDSERFEPRAKMPLSAKLWGRALNVTRFGAIKFLLSRSVSADKPD